MSAIWDYLADASRGTKWAIALPTNPSYQRVQPGGTPAPTMTSLSVPSGTVAGGTAVTITGTSLTETVLVTYNGRAAPTSFSNDDNSVFSVTPPGLATGPVIIRLVTSQGVASIVGAFSYT